LIAAATLSVTSTSNASNQIIDIENPRFFDYSSGSFEQQIFNLSFGWFKTLDKEQRKAYLSSLVLALEEANPGQYVKWYESNASGSVRVAWILPDSMGYCKRLHIEAIAYNTRKNYQVTACFNGVDNRWRWYQ
jgi:hypothetical protein